MSKDPFKTRLEIAKKKAFERENMKKHIHMVGHGNSENNLNLFLFNSLKCVVILRYA